MQAGLLNGKSIGFLPLKVHVAEGKEADKRGWPQGTLVIDEWMLLEYACCYLPCNQDSLVEAVSKSGLALPGWAEAALLTETPARRPAPAAKKEEKWLARLDAHIGLHRIGDETGLVRHVVDLLQRRGIGVTFHKGPQDHARNPEFTALTIGRVIF